MRLSVLAIAALGFTACWWTYPEEKRIEKFVNHDIRDMIAYYGPVHDAYERVDGLRMFQWKQKSPYTQPPVAQVILDAKSYDRNPVFNPLSILSTRNPNHLKCVYTLGARLDDTQNIWRVEEVQLPAKRCKDIK